MSIFAANGWLKFLSDWRIFADGFMTTLYVVILSLLLSLVLGVVFGVFSASHARALRIISRIYVEFYQNTPLVIQIFFMYNVFPYLDIRMDILTIGVIGVGVYHGAYMSEVVRTGIQSIPKGQLEAAGAQGFNYLQTMYHIVLPQALKVMLPPLTNVSANLVKNTSVLAMVAGGDLMYRADSWSGEYLYYGPAYVVTGVLYFIICFPLARLSGALEARFGATPKPKDYSDLIAQYTTRGTQTEGGA